MRCILVVLLSAALATMVACGFGSLSGPSGSGPVSGSDSGSGAGAAPGAGADSGGGGAESGDPTSGGSGGDSYEDGGSHSGGVVVVSGGSGSDASGSGSSGDSGSGDGGSGGSGAGPSSDGSSLGGNDPVASLGSGDSIPAQTERLQVVNNCSYTIWLQQQNMVGVPSVIRLDAGGSAQFSIPDAGMAATRLWPKMGCDDSGNNCLMGQSSSPCPENGCPPPVDSKFEATWGCLLSDRNACTPNPSAPWERLSGDTYWNTSAVDGYTFPFTASVVGNSLPAEICAPVDCSNLTMTQCPSSENLSVGVGGAVSPLYSSVDLHLRNQGGALMGCYAPCTAMTYPTYGGLRLSNVGTEAAMYCCPTPPIGPSECSSGPVEATQYVARVRSMCGGTVYTYAYDDGNGLRQCSGATKVRLIIGPNCP